MIDVQGTLDSQQPQGVQERMKTKEASPDSTSCSFDTFPPFLFSFLLDAISHSYPNIIQ